ncbi:MAG: hypothetical protein GXC78_18350 [Chitinophagaceae bacterium]|nr:hypothetical protein [Chitinophagaceae bacterium]
MNKKQRKLLRRQFFDFIETHPPGEFNPALRRMLLDYMAREINVGFYTDFDMLLFGLSDLFELLDSAQKYQLEKVARRKVAKDNVQPEA